MHASCTTKGFSALLSRVGNILGASTRSMSLSPALPHKLEVGNNIEDNVNLQRFEMQINNDVAYVEYQLHNNIYDLVESLVPKEYSGQGLGKLLARRTFDHIISQNGRMKLTCDFLIYFYNQNKDEYKCHVTNE